MGPFLIAVRQLKFLVVRIDYFTKWMEAEALATITENNIRSFVWKNIICRYGIPRMLVSDNEKQFDNSAFRNFCSKLGIKNHYSSPTHKPMDRLKLQTDPCSRSSRLGSKGQSAYGRRNYQVFYRHTGQQ